MSLAKDHKDELCKIVTNSKRRPAGHAYGDGATPTTSLGKVNQSHAGVIACPDKP